MIPLSKSEWFLLDSPIGEPDIKWPRKEYEIERVTTKSGDVLWFGESVNWEKKKDGVWTRLGVDENVKPTVFIPSTNGMGDYYEYPEGRNIMIPCEMPIYEKLYLELNTATT